LDSALARRRVWREAAPRTRALESTAHRRLESPVGFGVFVCLLSAGGHCRQVVHRIQRLAADVRLAWLYDICLQARAHTRTHARTQTRTLTHAHAHRHTRTHKHAHSHARTRTHTHARTQTRTLTHAHAHAHAVTVCFRCGYRGKSCGSSTRSWRCRRPDSTRSTRCTSSRYGQFGYGY
jgi:hypothetical protein